MAETGTHIRAFETEDLDVIQNIRAQAFVPVFQSFRAIVGASISAIAFAQVEAEQAHLLEEICSAGSTQRVFVAVQEDQLVGFVSLSLDHKQKIGEIGLNAVHPDYAGQGIGTLLYDYALGQMRSAGMKVAVVGTGGDPSHAPARRAYA